MNNFGKTLTIAAFNIVPKSVTGSKLQTFFTIATYNARSGCEFLLDKGTQPSFGSN